MKETAWDRSTGRGGDTAGKLIRAADGGLRKCMLIGDVEVAVPLPSLPKRRAVSKRATFRQVQKQIAYESIYSEVYAAKDATAISTEKRKGQRVEYHDDGSGDANGDGVERMSEERGGETGELFSTSREPPAEERRKEALLREAESVSRYPDVLEKVGRSYKKPRLEKAKKNSKFIWTFGRKADGTLTRRGAIDLTTSPGEVKGREEEAEEAVFAEEELDEYLLNSEEQRKKNTIWEKSFRVFMDERLRRQKEREAAAAAASGDMYTQGGKLKKKYAKKIKKGPDGVPLSAAQAAMHYVGQIAKPSSGKINYAALKGVFKDDGSFAAPSISATPTGSTAGSVGSGGASFVAKTAAREKSPAARSMNKAVVAAGPTGHETRPGPLGDDADEMEEVYEEDDALIGGIGGIGGMGGGGGNLYENEFDEYCDEYY